jgi:hypothetical protein
MDERYTAVNFFKSSLATEDWPGDAYHMYRVTKRAFRIFFSLLYGARLTLDQILGCPVSEYDRDHGINGEAFTITRLVCAYAELYGCCRPREEACCKSEAYGRDDVWRVDGVPNVWRECTRLLVRCERKRDWVSLVISCDHPAPRTYKLTHRSVASTR